MGMHFHFTEDTCGGGMSRRAFGEGRALTGGWGKQYKENGRDTLQRALSRLILQQGWGWGVIFILTWQTWVARWWMPEPNYMRAAFPPCKHQNWTGRQWGPLTKKKKSPGSTSDTQVRCRASGSSDTAESCHGCQRDLTQLPAFSPKEHSPRAGICLVNKASVNLGLLTHYAMKCSINCNSFQRIIWISKEVCIMKKQINVSVFHSVHLCVCSS